MEQLFIPKEIISDNYEEVQENILDFFEFIYIRQEIWHKRNVQKQEWPWTENEVLQKYRFCNVYRELDKCTRYLDQLILQNKNMSLSERVLNTVGFRFFNVFGFFTEILDGYFDPYTFPFESYEKTLDEAKKNGPIFNNAYITTQQPYNTEYRKSDKHVQFLFVLQEIANNREDFIERVFGAPDPESSWKEIKKTKLIGRFLAYELWTDFSYLKAFPFTDDDFAHAGPGAEWGLEIIFGVKKRKLQPKLMSYLHDTQSFWFERLKNRTGKDWFSVKWSGGSNEPYLSQRNIEHSLCEFRKFCRLSNGQGKRRLYKQKT